MRTEINGVADIEKLKADAKAFIQGIDIAAAEASGDKIGYIVNLVQEQMEGEAQKFPLTNDEVVELYNEVYPPEVPTETPIEEPLQ